jgi:predicted transposase/invertase (TIGR01784 family)
MKESAVYQEILQEGEQLGLKKGKIEIAQQLLKRGMTLEEVMSLTGLSEPELQQGLSN